MTGKNKVTPTARDYEASQKLVRELTDATIDDAMTDLGRASPFPKLPLLDFYLSLKDESDRGLAIVILACIDDAMRDIFAASLNRDVDGGIKSLLNYSGPLGSAGLRIQMAYALRWLEPETYRSLRAMQKIRNLFAHELSTANFGNARISDLIKNIHPFEDKYLANKDGTEDIDPIRPGDIPPRLRFHLRAIYTCSMLIIEMTSAAFCIPRGLHPSAMLSRGLDKMTSEQQDTLLAAFAATRILLSESK